MASDKSSRWFMSLSVAALTAACLYLGWSVAQQQRRLHPAGHPAEQAAPSNGATPARAPAPASGTQLNG